MLFLDLKSHYSIKKAFGSPETVVEKAKSLGATHCALTDYDSISGCISFVKACKEASIKPILGCTFSVTEGGRLTVLAKNLDGWKALLKAVSLSYTKEFYDATNERPYLSIAKLKELGKDWIAIIGIPGDILCKRIFRDYVPYHQKTSEIIENAELDPVGTLETLHKELSGSFHNVLVGISPNNTDFTIWMNQVIGDSTFKKVGLTNSHYPEDTDYTYFRLQMCSHLKSTKNHWMKVAEQREPELLKFKENSWYLRKLGHTNLELSEEFCDYEILSPPKLPTFECPNGKTPNEYLRELCRIGWKKLLTPDVLKDKQDIYLARIKEELDVIEDAGLASYFLIVSDFIRYTISLGGLTSPGRGCVHYNTNVFTKYGCKPIGEIEINDVVVTLDGKSNKVLDKLEYDVNEELLKFTTFFGDYEGLTLTKDHECYVIKRERFFKNNRTYYKPFKFEPNWCKASELQTGDLIAFPKIKSSNIDFSWDLSKYCFEQKNGTKSFIDGDNVTYYKTGNQSCGSQYLKSPKIVKLDEEFAYVLGVFTGDGWVRKEHQGATSFCFHSITKLDSQKRVEKFMRSIGCDVKYIFGQNDKLVNQLHFINGTISRLFRDIFSEYRFNPSSKSIPSFIFDSSKTIMMSYLEGLIRSDGSISDGRITFCTISKKLAYQVKLLCLHLGIPAAIRKEDRIDTREEFKNRKRAYYVGMPDFINRSGSKKSYYEDENFIYTGIRKIEPVNDIKKVYDLTVENESNYTTGCGIIHNSVGGSLIAYLTNITRIDPIEYGLLFSRFFSSARKGSMPDIDVDFPTGMREEVVEYVRNKYGRDKVCHIATFSEIKGATAIKEVLRINDVCGFEQMNEITKAIPEEGKIADQMESSGISSILEWTLRHMPDRLKDYARYDGDELVGDYAAWFKDAIKLEGTIQGTGKHASALVVFDNPLSTVCPMMSDKSSDEPIAGLDMGSCEKIGMIKFDFLGLSSINKCLEVNKILKTRSAHYRSLYDKGI